MGDILRPFSRQRTDPDQLPALDPPLSWTVIPRAEDTMEHRGVPGEAQLRVGEAFLDDTGRGLVRLDAEDLRRLNAVPGDVLQVTGRRSTVARAAEAPESHCGQLLAMIDGITRGNAQVGVDDWVAIRKLPVKPADAL